MERTFVHRVRLKPPRVGVSVTHVCQQWSFEGGTAPVIGVPYSATETVESATTYRDDNRTVQGNTNRRLYRDSHGRTRVDSVFIPAGSEDNPVPTGIAINDPVAGKQYWLNPEQKVFNAVAWRWHPRGARDSDRYFQKSEAGTWLRHPGAIVSPMVTQLAAPATFVVPSLNSQAI